MTHEVPKIAIVVPCYNEQSVLPRTAPLFIGIIKSMASDGLVSHDSKVLFVDDGSKDETWKIISDLSATEKCVAGISQSRNRGHQNAVLAGLMEVRGRCDAAISIDCDGQDDINAIREMVKAYCAGFEVVYGVRSSRETDTFFKRFTAQFFYRMLSFMGAEVVFNHADYRLLGASALNALAEFRETNLFLRGLVPLVGFRSTTVTYERAVRIAGESHYPFRKMLALAVDGITSVSVMPLRIITCLGILVSFLSLVGIAWAVTMALLGRVVAGWASMTCIVCLASGVQLVGMGVMGEYIGKIYLETKRRPRYIIASRTGVL